MSLNINNLIGGAVQVKVDGTAVSHTRGGVKVDIKPQTREQTVDNYGNTAVNVVHVGDSVNVTVPYVQWDNATLLEMYDPALNATTSSSGKEYVGVGRSAGYVYRARALLLLPFITAQQNKALEFWRATPVGDLSIALSNENDRILERQYVCMADPSHHNDGEYIGRLYLGWT